MILWRRLEPLIGTEYLAPSVFQGRPVHEIGYENALTGVLLISGQMARRSTQMTYTNRVHRLSFSEMIVPIF